MGTDVGTYVEAGRSRRLVLTSVGFAVFAWPPVAFYAVVSAVMFSECVLTACTGPDTGPGTFFAAVAVLLVAAPVVSFLVRRGPRSAPTRTAHALLVGLVLIAAGVVWALAGVALLAQLTHP